MFRPETEPPPTVATSNVGSAQSKGWAFALLARYIPVTKLGLRVVGPIGILALMVETRVTTVRRPFRIRISVTAKELELIRIAAAKEGLRPTSYVYMVAVDAALRVA